MQKNEISKCIGCKICTNNCDFLKKYNLTLGDSENLKELAYHCFLCGECSEKCPVGIDGKELILKYREEQVKNNNNRLKAKGYSSLLFEKGDYLFKNYKKGKHKSVLFPGCNFPSLYPKTMKILSEIMLCNDVGLIFDCCGKPISYLGLDDKADSIIKKIDRKLIDLGVEEIVTLCPNCYHYFKGRLSVDVIGIYEKFAQLGIESKFNLDKADIFIPCPDKKNGEIFNNIKNYMPNTDFKIIKEIQCCGLGGCAGVYEGEIAKGFTDKLIKRGYTEIYSYCASCAGNFASNGMKKSHHILSVILGVDEEADINNSLINRIKTKIY